MQGVFLVVEDQTSSPSYDLLPLLLSHQKVVSFQSSCKSPVELTEGEEQHYTTARKPGPLEIIQYTLTYWQETYGGFIKGILRGVRCTKSLRVLFLHRRPPSWTILVLNSRAVFLFNEPACKLSFFCSLACRSTLI
jgi:hypothetical protein